MWLSTVKCDVTQLIELPFLQLKCTSRPAQKEFQPHLADFAYHRSSHFINNCKYLVFTFHHIFSKTWTFSARKWQHCVPHSLSAIIISSRQFSHMCNIFLKITQHGVSNCRGNLEPNLF